MNFDFLQKLRLQNIFGNMGQPEPTMGGPYNPGGMQLPAAATSPIMDDGNFDVTARMKELFQPETQSIDRFNQMIGEYPEYERPGMLKRIGAVALGTVGDLFGPKGSGQMAFNEMSGLAPHQRKVTDWKNQIDPLKDAANIERQSNTNNRTMAYQTVAAELRQRADEARANNNAVKAEIASRRADVYEFKARNPMARIVAQKGGNIMAINPITGETIRDFGPSGEMTDQDRLNMEQQNALGRIEATGDQARETQGVRHEDTLEEIAARGDQSRRTRQTPTATQSGREELPTQTRVREFNAARGVANTRRDLAPFIKFGNPGTNDFEIIPPTERWYGRSGPTEEQYKELVKAIYPERYKALYPETPAPAPTVTPGPRTNVPPPAVNRPGGRASGPGNAGSNQEQANAARRNQAIEILKQAGKPVTAANIDYVLKNMR